MTAEDTERNGKRVRRRSVVRYVLAWAAGGALVALVLVTLLGGQDDESSGLPPLRQTALADAARAARCELRGQVGRAGLNPPVDGSRGVAARPGLYDSPPEIATLVAAVRRGIVVIHYRQGLDDTRVDQLRKLQPAVPAGTIVAPNGSGMRYEVAATAYRRLLGCPRFTDQAIDALRLFRGRYLGLGPDRRP